MGAVTPGTKPTEGWGVATKENAQVARSRERGGVEGRKRGTPASPSRNHEWKRASGQHRCVLSYSHRCYGFSFFFLTLTLSLLLSLSSSLRSSSRMHRSFGLFCTLASGGGVFCAPHREKTNRSRCYTPFTVAYARNCRARSNHPSHGTFLDRCEWRPNIGVDPFWVDRKCWGLEGTVQIGILGVTAKGKWSTFN